MASAAPDFLHDFDAAGPGGQLALVLGWMESHPLEFFEALRGSRPVLAMPGAGCVLVTRFRDVTDLLQMPRVVTVEPYKSKMGVGPAETGYLMAHDDDALHTREKSLMQGMLNRDDLPRVRALVAKRAKSILDGAGGEIELVNGYCRAVPACLVQEYFGLDGVDRDELVAWSFWNQYDAFHNQPFHLNSPQQDAYILRRHGEVSGDLGCYMAVLIARKILRVKVEDGLRMLFAPLRMLAGLARSLLGAAPAAAPSRDDMVKRMLRSSFAREVDFPLARVGTNAGGLLIGAIETTSQAVAQVIEYFLDASPGLLQEAQRKAAQEDPGAFDAMVWEALRFVPISPYLFRRTAAACVVGRGTAHEAGIPAGTDVLLATQSAMFDPEAFKEPEKFDPDRNWYHHFNFGFGSHECLGKHIGMVMIPEMVRQVLLRDGVSSPGTISYRNGALYGDGPEAGKDGPFPEDYRLAWR